MVANYQLVAYKQLSARALRPLDLCLIVIGYLLTAQIAGNMNQWQAYGNQALNDWSTARLTLLLIAIVSWSAASAYSDIYAPRRDVTPTHAIWNLLSTLFLWSIICVGMVFLTNLKYGGVGFTLWFLGCAGALILCRQIATSVYVQHSRRTGYDRKLALILGDKMSCERFIAHTNRSPLCGYHFQPVSNLGLDTLANNGSAREFKVDDGSGLTESTLADEIFIVSTALGLEASDNPVGRLLKQGKAVHIVPEVIDARLFRQTLSQVGGLPVLSLSCGRLSRFESFAKRAFDLASAVTLLLLTSPIMVATAALVKLTSPGPALFSQKRLGKGGRIFTLYKFRTMHRDAERKLAGSPDLYRCYLANNFKLPPNEDPRLTAVGAFLRAFSIDELPQLINVVKGEMSLVGPRPIVPAELDNYGEFASVFLSVKPGMTGQWQVSGRSEIREYQRRVELDLEYIRDQSIRTDLGILFRTVPSVLRRKGAF
jgi:exopolysaccharide production protein ExoY